MDKFDFAKLAGGALIAQINREGQRIFQNIEDPNTDATKVRTITATIKIKATEDRSVAAVNMQTKASLQPSMPTSTNIMIERDIDTGMVVASELGNKIPGQMEINTENPKEPEVKTDTNVIDLKKANTNK